jgi:probable HAF family extracellular repeat protein
LEQQNKTKSMKATTHHLGHMNRTILNLSLLVPTLALALMARAGQPPTKAHPRYQLIDLGTFGGPFSTVSGLDKSVNNAGTIVGAAETAIPDPFAPICGSPNCFIQHAFQWQRGVLTDLGALSDNASSYAIYITDNGHIGGLSENGLIDPLMGSPEWVAVLWKDGQLINLGTLGGNGSIALALNNHDQVVGGAANTILDPFSLSAILGNGNFATQTRAFLWENGVMRDLGTLGGPDSTAWFINEGGQVAGVSYADSTPNDTTGLPTLHPFLWQNGQMHDLGSLGGSWCGVDWLNNHGAVVGSMTLPGDEVQHPFLWSGGTLTDLGTFGGSNGEAVGVNDAGEVAGEADFPGDAVHDAFLWKNGVMIDLGNLGLTSFAHAINARGQVVGASRVRRTPSQISAFLWENGGPMVDLNTLIPANSSLHLAFAEHISDSGEISGTGVPPGVSVDHVGTLGHAFLLIPVGEE